MAEVTSGQVKELREKTGAGMMDCRKALQETNGDMGKAAELMRQKGIAGAGKRAEKTAKEGLVYPYIHMNEKLGVLLEINCETDFVARTEDFRELAKEVAMQIAAMNPLYVSRDQVPSELIEKEKEIYKAQMADQKKPANVIDKIIEGKLVKFYQDFCLLDQAYIKDDKKKIEDLVKEKIAKLGENIVVKRFARFVVGEK